MATEELRLSVSLVDNVSSQLERIKSSLQNMGGGPQAAGMESLKRQTSELTEGVKGLGAGFSNVADAGMSMARAAAWRAHRLLRSASSFPAR